MNTQKKIQIVQEVKKVWLELDEDAQKDKPENENPIIYILMDGSFYVGWREEQDESWYQTQTMVEFKFSETKQHEIKQKVFDGIEDYLNKLNHMKILNKPSNPRTKMARTVRTSNAGLYSWSSITVADAMEAIKQCELAEFVIFHETNNMGKHEGLVK